MKASSETPLLDRLAVLDEAVVAAAGRGRALSATAAEHAATIARIKQERIAAYSADDERAAATLRKKTADAEARAVELTERREGADMATSKARAERDRYVVEHHADLVRERTPIAKASVKAIQDAVASLVEGVKAWHAEESAQLLLMRPVPNRDGREIAGLGAIDDLTRDLRRAIDGPGEGVPAPTPRPALTVVAPAPEWPVGPVVKTVR